MIMRRVQITLKRIFAMTAAASLGWGAWVQGESLTLSGDFEAGDSIRRKAVDGGFEFQYRPNSAGWVNTIGSSGGDAVDDDNVLQAFQLPDLTGLAIENVTYTVTKTEENSNLDWDVQLYAFDPGVVPGDVNPLSDIWWYSGDEDTGGPVTAVDLEAFAADVDLGTVSMDLTEAFNPGGVLAGFYDESGAPLGDGMIWFRLNPGADLTGSYNRIRIGNTPGEADASTLQFQVIPEPGTYALIGGLAAAFLVLYRRRR